MSFLDSIDINSFEDNDVAEVDTKVYADFGDIILYNQKRDRFEVASNNKTYISVDSLSDYDYILIGIVIRQNEDTTVDVLMCNFLMDSPKILPYELDFRTPEFIRNYMYDMFKRYVAAFRKKCPDYPRLNNMVISLPTVEDIDDISKNIGDFLFNYRIVVEEDVIGKFISRMLILPNHILCIYKKKLYTVTFNLDKDPIYKIEIPDARMYDFLCVFRGLKISGYDNYDEDLKEMLEKFKLKVL